MTLINRLLRVGLPTLLGCASALPSLLAFGTPGHMATGSIAFHSLKAQPGGEAVIQAAVQILEHHPFITGPWANQLAQLQPGTVSRAERLFMLAAQWPDEVRSGTWSMKYHHADWHYVNLRYTAGKNTPGPAFAGRLLETLDASLRTLRDPNAGASDRAVALCWVFHQVGDLHQPLHVTALVSKKYPNGDRGGNEFYVRPAVGAAPNNLHSLWDSYGVKRDEDFAGVQDNAVRLISAHPRLNLSELPARAADAFAAIASEESFAYAAAYAYLNGKLKPATEQEAKAGKVKTLPKTYSSNAGAIAARRLAAAGYRMADLLRSSLSPH